MDIEVVFFLRAFQNKYPTGYDHEQQLRVACLRGYSAKHNVASFPSQKKQRVNATSSYTDSETEANKFCNCDATWQ